MQKTADLLFELRRTNTTLPDLPAALKPTTEAEAYRTQDALVKQLTNLYDSQRIGYKVGCTSQGAQTLLNTDGPLFGHMLSSHHFRSPATLDTLNYSMIVIEPEFGFRIGKDVPQDDYDATSIQPFMASVIPSIEVVHHRLGSWDKFNAPITIADNAIHGCWVQGEEETTWQQVDYQRHEVKLYVDDELTTTGRAELALGSPLNVLAWLATTLPKHGHTLKQNDLVTTGVCMDVFIAHAGQKLRADFGLLGEVHIDLI